MKKSEMQQLLKESLDMLYAVQWSGSSLPSVFDDSDSTQFSYCPSCEQVEYRPHDDNCVLNNLIKKLEKAVEEGL